MQINKIKLVLAAACCVFGLAACGGGGGGGGGGGASTSTGPTGGTGTSTGTTGGTSTGSSGGSTTPTTPTIPQSTVANQIPITVDQGPTATTSQLTANEPYVTVTICDASGNCKTIDHMLLDTGSDGVRVFASAMGTLTLPHETVGGNDVGECTNFVTSYMWGPVETATVKLGSEVATNIPIQVVDDSTFAPVPSGYCFGTDISSYSALGANGIVGVGMFKGDSGKYLTCDAAGACTSNQSVPFVVVDPVSAFPQDNNGVIVTLPAVTSTTQTTTGTLTFGLGTQADDALTGYTPIQADDVGNLSVEMNSGVSGATETYPKSFIDSGSNAYFINTQINTFDGPYLAPTSPVAYTTTLSSTMNASQTYGTEIDVVAPTFAQGKNVYADLATQDLSTTSQDLGFSFFYGKSIAFGIYGDLTPDGTGPIYALK